MFYKREIAKGKWERTEESSLGVQMRVEIEIDSGFGQFGLSMLIKKKRWSNRWKWHIYWDDNYYGKNRFGGGLICL
jgi:hypothetical protein